MAGGETLCFFLPVFCRLESVFSPFCYQPWYVRLSCFRLAPPRLGWLLVARSACAVLKVLVYGIAKGNLEHVFSGDEPGRHTGELLGHSGVITALFFYKHMVYTGSMDCTVQVRARR